MRNDHAVHVNAVGVDTTLACIARALGRPVLRHVSVDNRLRLDPCPATSDELYATLVRDTLRLVDGGASYLLMSSRFLPPYPADLSPYAPRMKWKRLDIEWRLDSVGEGAEPGMRDVVSQVLEVIRPIPVAVDEDSLADGSADVTISVAVQRVMQGPDSGAGVVVSVGQAETRVARLAYGVVRAGHLIVLWDSPLFRQTGQGVAIEDVTGDARPEFVVESETDGNQRFPVLVIFDANGTELTRQTRCDTQFEVFDSADGVCAIKGSDVHLSDRGNGARTIHVNGWSDDGKDHDSYLREGRFVPGPAAPQAR